jgi:hypothetical protein
MQVTSQATYSLLVRTIMAVAATSQSALSDYPAPVSALIYEVGVGQLEARKCDMISALANVHLLLCSVTPASLLLVSNASLQLEGNCLPARSQNLVLS